MTNPVLSKAFRTRNGISFDDEVYLIFLTFDPSTIGFASPVGSVSLTTGGVYRKFDTADTDWEKLVSATTTIVTEYYLGDSAIDGTWRLAKDNNDLIIQRREASTYNTKVTMTSGNGVDSTQLGSQTGKYFGESDADSSWRAVLRSTNLSFQRRESGVWNYNYEIIATSSTVTDSQDDNTNALYIEANTTDNHFRIVREGNNLNFERRESSVWKVYTVIEP